MDREGGEIEARWLVEREVGEDLASGAAEFEAVARAGAGDDDIGVEGVAIDDEMFVGGVSVHADGGVIEDGFEVEIFFCEGGDGVDLFFCGVIFEIVGIDGSAAVVGGELGAVAEVGEAIEHLFLFIFPDEDRHFFGPESIIRVPKPEQRLAVNCQRKL